MKSFIMENYNFVVVYTTKEKLKVEKPNLDIVSLRVIILFTCTKIKKIKQLIKFYQYQEILFTMETRS